MADNTGCEKPRPIRVSERAMRDAMEQGARNLGMAPGGVVGYGPPAGYPDEVVIQRVANGFIVRIGCKTFVGNKWSEVASGLNFYWENPEAAQKEYCKR